MRQRHKAQPEAEGIEGYPWPLSLAVDEQIAALAAMVAPELRQLWSCLFDRPPPKYISRVLLRCALAYRVQEEAESGLKKSTLKRLAAPFETDDADASPAPRPASGLRPGTRLVREWHGETYQVTVLDDGFDYQGRHYRSLSEIARAITGARWSGPLFFGLKTPSVENDVGAAL